MFEFHPFVAVQFYSALWGICRLYTQVLYFFTISHSFPMVGHFWPKTIYYYFYGHLACLNHTLNLFLCSHSKCHKSHQVSYHSDEAVNAAYWWPLTKFCSWASDVVTPSYRATLPHALWARRWRHRGSVPSGEFNGHQQNSLSAFM